MEFKQDNLTKNSVLEMVKEHLRDMAGHSPPESVHALQIDGLKQPDITFWSAWEGDELVGMGALKELDTSHGEIKSMRTASKHLRKGIASQMLQHILVEAKKRGYNQLSLETGTAQAFDAARKLYERHGFAYCGPFSSYIEDPNSVFMTRKL